MRKFLLLFFPFVFIVSCGHKDKMPKNILPEAKMRAVLWDMISASQYLNLYMYNKDSIDKIAAGEKAYGQVFQLHHITKEEFDKSYTYYRQHPDLMKVILDSLSKKQNYTAEKFEKKNDTAQKRIPKLAD